MLRWVRGREYRHPDNGCNFRQFYDSSFLPKNDRKPTKIESETNLIVPTEIKTLEEVTEENKQDVTEKKKTKQDVDEEQESNVFLRQKVKTTYFC